VRAVLVVSGQVRVAGAVLEGGIGGEPGWRRSSAVQTHARDVLEHGLLAVQPADVGA
jgi:hypothetical protein